MKADSCSSGHDETGRTSVEGGESAPSVELPRTYIVENRSRRGGEPQRFAITIPAGYVAQPVKAQSASGSPASTDDGQMNEGNPHD